MQEGVTSHVDLLKIDWYVHLFRLATAAPDAESVSPTCSEGDECLILNGIHRDHWQLFRQIVLEVKLESSRMDVLL